MPSPVEESLIALASSITPAITPGSLGKYTLSLTTPNPLTVPDTVPVRTVAPGQVDLTFLVKNVRFTNPVVTDGTTVGGMPIQLFATQLLDGGVATAGVPGLLGGVTGTVPVVIDSVGSLLNVQVQVRVSVRDDKNRLDPYVNWSFSTGANGVGGSGTSTPGTALPSGLLQWRLPVPNSPFVGAFTELTNSLATGGLAPQLAGRTITVEVSLGAAGVSTGWIALPALPIQIPAIPIPTLAAFFDDVAFNATSGNNGTLILLPDDSPLAPAAGKDEPLRTLLSTALNTLRGLVNGLVTNATGTGGFNPFNPLAPLASILHSLVDDMTSGKSATEVHWGKASSVPYLGNFHITDAHAAQDHISAIIVLGPLGMSVNCFNNANFDSSAGTFSVIVGEEMAVAVPSLLPANPPTVPLGHIGITVPRSGWNDCLSCVQIVKT
jgi:hypothetical protein